MGFGTSNEDAADSGPYPRPSQAGQSAVTVCEGRILGGWEQLSFLVNNVKIELVTDKQKLYLSTSDIVSMFIGKTFEMNDYLQPTFLAGKPFRQ